jgi:hypothetical protein
MRSIFWICLFLTLSLTAYAQDDAAPSPEEEKLCKEVANDIIAIYDGWSPQRDYDILYPRVKGFIDDFYSDFPDFGLNFLVKNLLIEVYTEKLDEIDNIAADYPGLTEKLESDYPGVTVADVINDIKKTRMLTDYEKRALVAFKGMKDEKVFEEVSRFVTTKDFYWGYISDELNSSINAAAKKLKDYTKSRKDILLADHADFVASLLTDYRKFDLILDSIKTVSDEKIVDDLLDDETYNTEMMSLEFTIDSLRSRAETQAVLQKMLVDKDARIMNYISSKRKELIDNARAERIYTREYWVTEKRQTLFDLYELENARLSDMVTGFVTPMEEERNIVSFDITPVFIEKIYKNDPYVEEEFKLQIKHKFYSGLLGEFGTAVIYDEMPVFRTFRTNVLIGTFLFMILFFYIFIKVKNNREKLFIRRIPGLDAIDDAVGRATEMGKPVVYDCGIGYYTQIDTIASMLILRSVAKKVAEFKAEIYVPTCDPIIMQISEEMVASGFLDAGYPEDHKKDNVFFLAADQFAFAAGVAGILSRKKPATAFHFGYYAAESLLISEAGFAAGAIQVAGTTAVAQLPFFITACDYTLIGEELYAAAAYISRDAQIMTNLKLSDFAKITIGFLFIAGTVMLTINSEWTFLQDMLFTR